MKDLKKKYQEFYHALIRQKKLKKYLKNLLVSENLLLEELETLKAQKEKELDDVIRLEKLGLKRLFQKILGNDEQALEKERQEYLIAVMEYQAKEKELGGIQYQQKILKSALDKLDGISSEFNNVKKRMFFLAQLNDPGVEKELKKIRKNILDLSSQKGEIKEASMAGVNAINALKILSQELEKIDAWGANEVKLLHKYFGKGNYSSLAKKKYVNRSKGLLFKSLGTLNRFQEELKDVSKSLDIDFCEHEELLKNFLKIFLDNLITDWIVKNEIDLAFKSIEIVIGKIERLLKMLAREMDLCDVGMVTAGSREKEILLKYSKH